MTLVVADSSPIRYLAVLNAIDHLPRLYERVIVPRAVLGELTHPHAPVEARSWASALASAWGTGGRRRPCCLLPKCLI